MLRSLALTPPRVPEPEDDTVEAPTERSYAFGFGSERFEAMFQATPEELAALRNAVSGLRRREPESAIASAGVSTSQIDGPVTREPASSVSDRLLANLQAGDKRDFWWAFFIATVLYLSTIYGDTYGSVLDYVSAFAAGAGAAYATNFKLLPWFRSFRPAKAE